MIGRKAAPAIRIVSNLTAHGSAAMLQIFNAILDVVPREAMLQTCPIAWRNITEAWTTK